MGLNVVVMGCGFHSNLWGWRWHVIL